MKFKLIAFQSDIEKIDYNILKLGLLQGTLYDETNTDLIDLPEQLSYPIKLFHEFLSGYYASKQKQVCQMLNTISNSKCEIKCLIGTIHSSVIIGRNPGKISSRPGIISPDMGR